MTEINKKILCSSCDKFLCDAIYTPGPRILKVKCICGDYSFLIKHDQIFLTKQVKVQMISVYDANGLPCSTDDFVCAKEIVEDDECVYFILYEQGRIYDPQANKRKRENLKLRRVGKTSFDTYLSYLKCKEGRIFRLLQREH